MKDSNHIYYTVYTGAACQATSRFDLAPPDVLSGNVLNHHVCAVLND